MINPRCPANTRRLTNAGLMLGQRRRRWTNIKPTLGKRLVLAGCLFDLRNQQTQDVQPMLV